MLKEMFETAYHMSVAIVSIIVVGGSFILLLAAIGSLLGVEMSPESQHYKNQIERCRERGAAILDAFGYLKECRLKSFD